MEQRRTLDLHDPWKKETDWQAMSESAGASAAQLRRQLFFQGLP